MKIDTTLARYLEIGEEVAKLEAEKADIRAQLVPRGTFATDSYKVTVSTVERLTIASGGIAALIAKFGRGKLRGIVVATKYPQVTVKEIK